MMTWLTWDALALALKGAWAATKEALSLTFEDWRWLWLVAGYALHWPVGWLVAACGWLGRLFGWL